MELPLILQGSQFLLSVLLGLFYGLLYDLFKGLRQTLGRLTHLSDLLFVLCFLSGNLFFALYVGNGEYRIFMFLGTGLGIFLYFLTLRRLFFPFSAFFWRILTFPFRKLWQFFANNLKKLGKFTKNIFSSRKKSVIIKKQRYKKSPAGRLEEKTGASVQINTYYQADSSGAHDFRYHHHREPTAEN